MSNCKCSMAISVNGDGCRYCQPQEYIDKLAEWLEESRTECAALEAECERLRDQAAMFVWLRDKCHLFDHYRAMKHRPNAFEQEVRNAMATDAALSAKP